MRARVAIALVVAAVLVSSSARGVPEGGSNIAAVFDSMGGVLDIAYLIERYAIEHGRLPNAKSPADLSQALVGSDGMTSLLVDAWKTPLHIDCDATANTYVVASAGSDRKFERQQRWSTRAATRTAGDDIVVRNGDTIRWPEEWALEQFRLEGGDLVESLREARETGKAARTMSDMMSMATAIQVYVIERGSLPDAGNLDSLAAALEPAYITRMPRADAWGGRFAVKVVPKAETYRIVSAGSDGKLDSTRWSEKGKTPDYTRDAVLQDGNFTLCWDTTAETRELAEAYAGFTVLKLKHASQHAAGGDQRR